jgi:hypothetical protein
VDWVVAASNPKRIRLNAENPMIRAEVHSDDYLYERAFDATPWFEQASDDEIKALIECDFGGDYPADAVAEYMEDHDSEIERMFDYCRRGSGVGFECHVETEDAEKWIKERRPHLAAHLSSEQ